MTKVTPFLMFNDQLEAAIAFYTTDKRACRYHSLRRQFATELKDTPLRDLAHLGGWKDTSTLLTCYQLPDEATQRRALQQRRTLRANGLA